MNFENVIDNVSKGYIQKSEIHGNGLFANEDIKKGEILGYLDGQLIDWNQYHEIMGSMPKRSEEMIKYVFCEWNALSPTELLVRPLRTKYSFINHSRTPNIKLAYEPLRLVACQYIEKDQEFLLDYRKEPLNEEYLAGHGKTYL
jgi:SET domain-containing protein